MCGRYMLNSSEDVIAAEFDLNSLPELQPRYNIAPSQSVLVVRNGNEGREAVNLRWGLIPFWAKDPKIGYKMINARSETVSSKPAFRAAYRKRRCLVPADGYYEWRASKDGKQPFYIFPASGQCFAIAGLWERWRSDEETIETCTLLTCAANARLSEVHDRMPVVVARSNYEEWLAEQTAPSTLEDMLTPAPNPTFETQAVSKTVNSPRNDSAACIEPYAG